jgi:hypothetical protein
MDYKKIYDSLIKMAVDRKKFDGYSETHHIVPKCLGGSNSKSNLVKLTAREHFLAHYLLAKIYGGSLWAAVTKMSGNRRRSGFLFNSRLYEVARKKHAFFISESQKGRKLSILTKEKIAKSLREKESVNHPWTGRKHSQETKNKISLSNKGRILGEKNPQFGKLGNLSTCFGRVGEKHPMFGKFGENNKRTKFKFIATNVKTNEKLCLIGEKAMKDAGFSYSHVFGVISGKRKTHKNHTFEKFPL